MWRFAHSCDASHIHVTLRTFTWFIYMTSRAMVRCTYFYTHIMYTCMCNRAWRGIYKTKTERLNTTRPLLCMGARKAVYEWYVGFQIIYMRMYIYACEWIHVYTHLYIYTYISICTFADMLWGLLCMGAKKEVYEWCVDCKNTYIHMHIHVYISIPKYTYMHA